MPRRSRRDSVAERTEQMLAEQAERRREAAQRGAETRRQRRAGQQGEAHPCGFRAKVTTDSDSKSARIPMQSAR